VAAYDSAHRLANLIVIHKTLTQPLASYAYTLDALGNRLTQQTLTQTIVYVYDDANRLSRVNGQPYTWDNNGNLLNDGVTTYAYDAANRLLATSSLSLTTNYTYNGLGDRVQQAMNGVPTIYAIDIAGGLTQVLADGANTYVYGLGRISQQSMTNTAYFLGDALGSVRQLASVTGSVVLRRDYDPYGNVLTSVGSGASAYGFTGEWTDNTSLVLLRTVLCA
jgi:YD repeat-containing protein